MDLALLTNDCLPLKWEGNGLSVPADAQLADFENAVRVLTQVGTISRIALGDLLTEAAKKGFEEQLTLVFEEVGLSPVEVGKVLAISSVPRSLRSESLNEEHYFVVSKLTLPDQTKWLAAAVKHHLNPLELKRSIEAGRVIKREEINELSGRGSGIVNYHGIVNQWERWGNNIGGMNGMDDWPLNVLDRWIDDVKVVKAYILRAEELREQKMQQQ